MKKIGGHVSAAGGIENAIERAAAIGGNCVQLFSGSPRVWRKKKLSEHDTKELFANQKEFGVAPIFTHALYLVNLGSEKPEAVAKSIDSIAYELEFDALVKGAGVTVHVGSLGGKEWAEIRADIADRIETILSSTSSSSKFLIENVASVKRIGSLEHVAWLLEELEKRSSFVSQNRLGWTFDTCHAFAAGNSLDPSTSINQSGAAALISEYNLWQSLTCVHVNDSRDPFGSGRDRHANLGDGEIPQNNFKDFLNLKQLKDVPFILEVPGVDGTGPDAENVKRLQKLLE